MKRFRLLIIVFLCLCSASCRKDRLICFDESEPLALAPDVSWAVVIDPYAAFRKENFWASEVSGHCRKCDILQVEGKSLSSDGVWYKFKEGWLSDSAVSVYTNKFKAKTAAAGLE